jgi:hypothetical protein
VVIEAIERGIIANSLSRSFDRYKADVYWYTSKQPISAETRIEMANYAIDQLGKRFAFWKAFLMLVKKRLGIQPKDDEIVAMASRFYCSQFVANVYRRYVRDVVPEWSDLFTSPGDIANSRFLERRRVVHTTPDA